jgi:hypothetical protein
MKPFCLCFLFRKHYPYKMFKMSYALNVCVTCTSQTAKNALEERQISNTWQQTLANNNAFKKKHEQSELRKCLLPFCPESYALSFIFQTHTD